MGGSPATSPPLAIDPTHRVSIVSSDASHPLFSGGFMPHASGGGAIGATGPPPFLDTPLVSHSRVSRQGRQGIQTRRCALCSVIHITRSENSVHLLTHDLTELTYGRPVRR